MKRAQSAALLLLAALAFWVWLSGQVESWTVWLAFPVIVLGIFGVYSLFTILKSVVMLKDYPREEQSLKEDIQRARDFYASKGIKL